MRTVRLLLSILTFVLSILLISSLSGTAPVAASQRPFQPGDVFAGVGNGQIKQFDATGALIAILDTTSGSYEQTGMCFDSVGNLYSTNFSGGTMTWFDTTGGILQHPWGGPFGIHPESCVVDVFGNIYTGEVDGAELIRKFNPQGDLLATFNPVKQDRGIDWTDLAPDQCTMFYTSEGSSVKRFDVCNNTQLPDFATGLPRPCYALRIRSNGEVMVACSSAIYRLDSSGTPIQTYPRSLMGESSFFFALNLDPDGGSFWTGGYHSKNVYRVDIETGTVLTSFNAGVDGPSLAGLAVFGEFTSGLADEDKDGIYDDWESNGIDTNEDGSQDLFLSELDEVGDDVPPNPRHKDVYVWVDWLTGHKPTDEALLEVKSAFATAPISHMNPDGQPGINLHIILGNAIPETPDLLELGSITQVGDDFDYDSQEFSTLKWQNLQGNGDRPGMAAVFHYALFAHNLPEVNQSCPDRTGRPTGIAPMLNDQQPGSDFIVALGQAEPLAVGGVFMHELGHTLNLGHGGPSIFNDTNYKPNHLSVMNYSFSTGLFYGDYPRQRTLLDYSRFDSDVLPNLDESSLNEWLGINGSTLALAGYGTVYYNGYSDLSGRLINIINLPNPVDWNNSGGFYETSVQANINRDDNPDIDGCQENYSTLGSENEWIALDYKTGSIGTAAALIQPYPTTTFVDGANVDLDVDVFSITDGVQGVEIDIKLGSDPNSINLKSKGVIPVAIITTDIFDAATVDPLSVKFGPNGATESHGKGHIEDVDSDGDQDLVLHFKTQDTGIQCGDVTASLTGETFDGQALEGSDSIKIVGCK